MTNGMQKRRRAAPRRRQGPINDPRDAVERGTTAAQSIAARLATGCKTDERWRRVDPALEKPRVGDAYGRIELFAIGERFDFSVWLDRTATLDEDDMPILCAAFGAVGGADGRALTALARSEDVPVQAYTYDQEQRLVGFGRAPVIDAPRNVSRYLSSYRPAGDFDLDEAIDQFRALWDAWRDRVASLADLPPRNQQLRADWRGRALRGLVGELAVLAHRSMVNARWVGTKSHAHDIERGRVLVEVKTRMDGQMTLSKQQIESHRNDRYFVATVDLPAEAALVLRGGAPGDRRLHPIVAANRPTIGNYLRRHGVAVDAALLAAISAAVRLSAKSVAFHHLSPPSGFKAALRTLETFGRVADLAFECGPEWLSPAVLPT